MIHRRHNSSGGTVSDLRVDPVDLALSADHMDMHGCDLRVSHAAANAAIDSAGAGWVGTSAAALQARLSELQAVTDDLCLQITTMGEHFRIASQRYSQSDSASADVLTREMGPAGQPASR